LLTTSDTSDARGARPEDGDWSATRPLATSSEKASVTFGVKPACVIARSASPRVAPCTSGTPSISTPLLTTSPDLGVGWQRLALRGIGGDDGPPPAGR
jgi:hypothetical protein